VWLNDVKVTDLTEEAFAQSRGRIVLQIHDGGGIKVLFRNMKIRSGE
jgi:hypothetical protein